VNTTSRVEWNAALYDKLEMWANAEHDGRPAVVYNHLWLDSDNVLHWAHSGRVFNLFTISAQLVSDIAVFVLKRDVKLKLTNYKRPVKTTVVPRRGCGQLLFWQWVRIPSWRNLDLGE